MARGKQPHANPVGGIDHLASEAVPTALDGDYQSPPRLKASSNNANGGVGVSYSNVVLAGGFDPRTHPSANFNSNSNMTTAQAMNNGERSVMARYLQPHGRDSAGSSLRQAASQVLIK